MLDASLGMPETNSTSKRIPGGCLICYNLITNSSCNRITDSLDYWHIWEVARGLNADVPYFVYMSYILGPGVGVNKPISSIPLYVYFSESSKYQLPITCHTRILCSPSAVAPGKYECGSKNLTGIFARSKISLTASSNNGAFVTPTPGLPVKSTSNNQMPGLKISVN